MKNKTKIKNKLGGSGSLFFLLVIATNLTSVSSDESVETTYPEKLDPKALDTLVEASPFQRLINIDEVYSLRAVVTSPDASYARVYNKLTKSTTTIKLGGKETKGLKLIEITHPKTSAEHQSTYMSDNYLSDVSAKVLIAGEIVELKYEDSMFDGDRKRDAVRVVKGPDYVRKLYISLNEAKRTKLRSYMQNVPRAQRFEKFNEAVERLSKGLRLK